MILDTDKIEGDAAYRDDLRHRFFTDMFFAAEILGFPDFVPRVHQAAVDLYGPKVPSLPMFAQPRKHKILHLDPRHTFKTTLQRVDRVQLLAAFPEEITFLCESATQPLATAIGKATAKYFYRPKGRPATVFQKLFFESITEKDPNFSSIDSQRWAWNMPNRKETGAGDLDASIAITSPLSTQSGWHPSHISPDDVEETQNSGISASQESRQRVIDVCSQNENLLRSGPEGVGYITIGGTRYHPFDWYGKCIERAKQNPEAWGVLIRASIARKDGGPFLPGEFPDEDALIFYWPEFPQLRYSELREKYMDSYESFMCQQQNDPQGGNVPTFPEKLYASCAIAEERLPHRNDTETYVCWRPRYGGKAGMGKYSEGAAATVVDGKVYVKDSWQGTYTPSGEAERIVEKVRANDADGVMIIGVPGCEYLAAHIRNEAAKKNRPVRIQWLEFEEDDNRRSGAIKRLEPLMKVGRVLFSSGMGKAAECQKQFVHFGLVEETGIIECISRFADMVPISLMRANMQEEEIAWQRRRREDSLVQSFLNQQGMPALDEQAQQKAKAHAAAMNRTTTFGMPPLPGGLDG